MTSIAKDGCVEFWFFRRDVRDVRIVGDFATGGATPSAVPGGASVGNTTVDGLAMTAGPDGWWRATVALAAGEYRFRYVADGVWYADYASNGIEVTKLGPSSILVVPESAVPRSVGRTVQGDVARMVA
jgi:1,4-alpha-glucan branching enzyme